MAIVVVGGHSRNVGKTSVVAGLIAALPEFEWTAFKITQYGHGICSAEGKPCDCACSDHSWAMSEEADRSGDSDSSRFLVAGARRSFWVRVAQGRLDQAMPAVLQKMSVARNVILESNSVLKFIEPELYLTVLDPATADFKDSAREYLSRADAIILHSAHQSAPSWANASMSGRTDRPIFTITPPNYVTPELARFVREKLQSISCSA